MWTGRFTRCGWDSRAPNAVARHTPHSALSIPHLNGSFPVFSLGWTIGEKRWRATALQDAGANGDDSPNGAKRLGVRQTSGALERGSHPDVAASRQSAANVTGILDGGFLPKAATPKRTGRALRNSQFAIRNGQGFFSGFHFGLDVWGIWRLNFLSREGREGGEVRRTGIFVETAA